MNAFASAAIAAVVCGMGCEPAALPPRVMTTGGGASQQQASVSSSAGSGGLGGAATTTGGGAASSAATGGSGGGGSRNPQGPATLKDDGLVVRYFLAEAAMGKAPVQAVDAAAEPLNLLIRYEPAMPSDPVQPHELPMAYTETARGNRGWLLPAINSHGGAYANVAGTKVESRLQGATAITLECVARIEASAQASSRLIHVGEGTGHTLGLETLDAGQIHVDFNERIVAAAPILDQLAKRIVIHAVIDSSQASPAERVRIYINGTRRPSVQVGNVLNKDETLMLSSMMSFMVANRVAVEALSGYARSIKGEVFYAAIYDVAMADSRIQTHYQRLLLNDDPPQK